MEIHPHRIKEGTAKRAVFLDPSDLILGTLEVNWTSKRVKIDKGNDCIVMQKMEAVVGVRTDKEIPVSDAAFKALADPGKSALAVGKIKLKELQDAITPVVDPKPKTDVIKP